jgi:hypothetical protein
MICAKCTNGILKQDYPNTIYCPYCVEYIYLGVLAMLGVGGVIAIINKRKDYQPRPDEPKKKE